jgi:hypothetical protein
MFSLGRPPLPEKGKGEKFNQLKKKDTDWGSGSTFGKSHQSSYGGLIGGKHVPSKDQ